MFHKLAGPRGGVAAEASGDEPRAVTTGPRRSVVRPAGRTASRGQKIFAATAGKISVRARKEKPRL